MGYLGRKSQRDPSHDVYADVSDGDLKFFIVSRA